jgi:mevalonate kinase
MTKEFYSNGKLLLTAEYLVLDGAQALALPTQFGQKLIVLDGEEGVVHWKSLDADGTIWYENEIQIATILDKNPLYQQDDITEMLIRILNEAHAQNPQILKKNKGYQIETQLTFPKNWGLGTSSTLINNVARWFNIDAFDLLQITFGGSGYDVACAQTNSPLLYQLINEEPEFKAIDFKPFFEEHLYFVYLNKKRNSREAIQSYREQNIQPADINEINRITQQVIHAETLQEFQILMNQHEDHLSKILSVPTIKAELFSDFSGSVKSLGAWGGDFVLVAHSENPTEYFKNKGYEVVIPYHQMVL